jgi:hypothetical protein
MSLTPVQVPATVHVSLVQVVPAGRNSSSGQFDPNPVQLSATSHSPATGLQMVVSDRYPSAQFPLPSQESVPSQSPSFDVPTQVVVVGAKPSGGHSPESPVQLSATSH